MKTRAVAARKANPQLGPELSGACISSLQPDVTACWHWSIESRSLAVAGLTPRAAIRDGSDALPPSTASKRAVAGVAARAWLWRFPASRPRRVAVAWPLAWKAPGQLAAAM